MRYALFGAGGHCTSILSGNYKDVIFMGVYDDNFLEHSLYCGNFLEMLNDYRDNKFDKMHIAIGNNQVRTRIYKEIIKQFGEEAIGNLISQDSLICQNVQLIGCGIFIGAFTYLGPNVIIHDNTIINTGSIIEHDCIINKHVFIGPNVTLAGSVVIEKNTFLGLSCSVLNGVRIASNCIVGAASLVTKDLISEGIYKGIPAKLENRGKI